MKTTFVVLAMVSLAAPAGAQVMAHAQQSKAATEQHLQVLTEKQATGVHLTFEAKPITGAPYAGEAVTETIQVLADGNRIVRRTTSRIYRDGKGRTRRESLGPDGQVTNIAITDPAAGTSVVFHPGTNTAHRTSAATIVTTSGSGSTGVAGGGGAVTYVLTTEAKQQAEQKAAQQHIELQAQSGAAATTGQAAGGATWVSAGGGASGVATWVSSGGGEAAVWSTPGFPASKEELGEQVVEGVNAKGTRTTTVIPAGAIGNEQPISITSEEWFSTDLKLLVMTKHVDPRAGETTYRLTGIVRGEPDPSLFDLPAGVVVK